MKIDLTILRKELIRQTVAKPKSGTLSGHAAGEPFDKLVYAVIKEQYPKKTFRQFEFLNDLFLKNPKAITLEQKKALLSSPTVLYLLSRGKNAIEKWDDENLFEEKQDDTADILIVDNDYYQIIDVKTRNIEKSAQPPNIISSYKLAKMCAYMIDNKDFNVLNIKYVEVDWTLEKDKLICKDVHIADLFKSKPDDLYINWAAAMQIQFHVCDLNQDYKGTLEKWVLTYIKHFVTSVYKRTKYMIEKYAKPFEKYLK